MSIRKAQSLGAQGILVAISIALFFLKFVAYSLTGSVAILTDALESTVNVVAGFVGLYSLRLSARPRDTNHPYGHGKIEYVSAAIEGTLVAVAGVLIVYKAVQGLRFPQTLQRLDMGILLIAATAVVNYFVGEYCIRIGQKNNSLALVASGTHLQSDTYTTIGLVGGLLLLYWTHIAWLDSAVAILFALVIVRTGLLIVRQSLSGIMDEADSQRIEEVAQVLSQYRRVNWIDVHHLRIVNYAGYFHIDCHLTVPRFFTVAAAHDEVDAFEDILRRAFEGEVEFSIHTDPCVPSQCSLCQQANCPVRSSVFIKTLAWNGEDFQMNRKHVL